MYAPGEFIERVSPTPLLMLVADHNYTAVTDLALKAFERALEPKTARDDQGRALRPISRWLRNGVERRRRLVQAPPMTAGT
jgi:uncharacterized protein